MCSEREPLDCHRCLLVGRVLARRGFAIGHILGESSIEPHSATEERLLAGLRPAAGGDLFGDRESRLAEAYRRRARRIAARLSDRVRPGRVPRAMSSYRGHWIWGTTVGTYLLTDRGADLLGGARFPRLSGAFRSRARI